MKCAYVESRIWLWSASPLIIVALGGALASCNSGSSTPSTPETTTATITIPMGDTLQNVSVLANQTTQFVFTHAIPPTTVTSWKPNLSATISQIHVMVPTLASFSDVLAFVKAAATESVSLSVRVAPASQRSTVCTTGIPYGPFTVNLTSAFLPSTVSPSTPEADAQTLAVMNAGAYVICVQIMSPVALMFSLDGWVVDVQQDCAAATASFAGPWSGTYTCTDTCTNEPFSGSVQLTVTQDSTGKASYTDEGGTTFSGTICGGEFRFVHNAADETERGSLKFTGSNTAQKTSTWLHSTLLCGGVCTDTLARR
jgi:hypothetical protein